MATYNFDEIIERRGTNALKYDGMENFLGTKDAIPMWVADMDFKSPPCIRETLAKRVEHGVFGYAIRPTAYFDAIRNWVGRRHGLHIENEDITFSPGVVAGITICIEQFTQPGDKIMVQSPVYFPFFQSIQDTQRETVYNELKVVDGRYHIDFELMEQQMDEQVKMLIISNPHNPGGTVWTRDELSRLSSICEKHNILVLSDEIHADMVYAPYKPTPFATVSAWAAQNTLTLMAPSKTFNTAGLTTSILIAQNKSLLDAFNKALHIPHLHMGNIFGSEALIAAFTEGEDWLNALMAYLQENVNLVKEFCAEHLPQLKVMHPESTYLIWIDVQALGMEEKELMRFFNDKARVAMNPGSMFGPGGEGYVRMNIGCPKAVVQDALNQIKQAIENL